MTDPRDLKYFHGHCLSKGRVVKWAVWDGWTNYEDHPAVPGLAQAHGMTGRIAIVQTHKKNFGFSDLDRLVDKFDSIIVWTRDHKTYLSVVANLKAQSFATAYS